MEATPWAETPEPMLVIEGTLDFNWWASDGPTGGYLISLAIEAAAAAGHEPHAEAQSIDLSVVRGTRADAFEASMVTLQNGSQPSHTAIVFQQNNRPFAIASLRGSHSLAAGLLTGSVPPDALPAAAYDEMTWESPSPPVTAQFSYRPVVSSDRTNLLSDCDLVWIRPKTSDALRYGVTAVVDSWYPANFMHSVRQFLRGATSELHQPAKTELLAVHATIVEPRRTLAHGEHVLLATRLIAASSGHYEEQFELWSEEGDLLLAGLIIRRAAPTPSAARTSNEV